MQPTIYIVPRWGGSAPADWYPRLTERLTAAYAATVRLLELPDWSAATINRSVDELDRQIPHLDEGTFLVGHSIGCQALLHYLTARIARGDTFRVGGLLAVAGWFTVDAPWPGIEPWLENDRLLYPELTERIRYRKVLLSDNDPYTRDHRSNAAAWRDRLNAAVTLVPGRAHFNGAEAEEVLAALFSLLEAAGYGPPEPPASLPLRAADPPIVVTETFPVPVARVWQALTDPWHMLQWYFEQIEDFRPVVGFRTEFVVRLGERTFTHCWRVTDAEAPSRIRYHWTYTEYTGDSYVDFRLQETAAGTRLTLTLEIGEDFPADVPEFTRGSCRSGWDYFIRQRLGRYLSGS